MVLEASEEIVATAAEIAAVPAQYARLQETFASNISRSYDWRMKNLKQLQKLLVENTQAIAVACKSDLNCADVTPHLVDCMREVEYMISHLGVLMGATSVTSRISIVNFPASGEVIPQPLGVVLILGTWNYPFHSSLGPLAGALAAGNTVVVKPGSLAQASSRLMAELVRLYFDPSDVTCIEGGKEISQPLLELKWDHIFFTGGTGIGKIVLQAAAHHLTPVTLELGGKNPVIVTASADVKLAARRIAWGKWASNAGQVCIAPDHVFVHSGVADAFLAELQNVCREFFGVNVLDSPDYGRIISRGHARRLETILTADKNKIVFGGEVDVENKFVSPTILDFGSDWSAFQASGSMAGEIFGPILPVVRFNDTLAVETYIAKQTRVAAPLAFYVFTSDNKHKTRQAWISHTASGAVVVNECGMHIVEDAFAFGGVGTSGIGSYHGKRSFEIFSHYKPVMWKSSWLDIPSRYPPTSRMKQRVVAFLLWLARKRVTPFHIGKMLLLTILFYKLVR